MFSSFKDEVKHIFQMIKISLVLPSYVGSIVDSAIEKNGFFSTFRLVCYLMNNNTFRSCLGEEKPNLDKRMKVYSTVWLKC